MGLNRHMKTWVVNGTYNEHVRNQIGSIVVSLERRHQSGAQKRKVVASTNASLRSDGTWVAIINGHLSPGPRANKPKLHVVVRFFDTNGIELFRATSAAL